ncbi:hypothetical protein HWV62_13022 [Athelia sp. TMB]|nr:hypothetical protein HWV62_13022 [Athelia sp. TMB]
MCPDTPQRAKFLLVGLSAPPKDDPLRKVLAPLEVREVEQHPPRPPNQEQSLGQLECVPRAAPGLSTLPRSASFVPEPYDPADHGAIPQHSNPVPSSSQLQAPHEPQQMPPYFEPPSQQMPQYFEPPLQQSQWPQLSLQPEAAFPPYNQHPQGLADFAAPSEHPPNNTSQYPPSGDWGTNQSYPDIPLYAFEDDIDGTRRQDDDDQDTCPTYPLLPPSSSSSSLPSTSSTEPFSQAPTSQPISYFQYLSGATSSTSSRLPSSQPPFDISSSTTQGPSMAPSLLMTRIARSAPGNVLNVARNKRQPVRAPNPYELAMRTPTLAPTVCSETSSASRRGRRTVTDPSGVQYEVLTTNRRAGKAKEESPRFSKNDRKNIKHAGNIYIAKMCLVHCWPEDGDIENIPDTAYTDKEGKSVKAEWVEEACTQANAHARSKNRAESVLDGEFFAEVRRYASAWRGRMKRTALKRISLWGAMPPSDEQQTMKPEEVHRYIALRVQRLRQEDGFCDVRTEDGNLAIYLHPAFLTFVEDFFYDAQGVARLVPGTFSALTRFPPPALALARTLVRIVMNEMQTGKHQATTLDPKRDRPEYNVDLAFINRVATKNAEDSPYNRITLKHVQQNIITRGRAISMSAGALVSNSAVRQRYSHVNHNTPLPPGVVDSEDEIGDADADGDVDLE